MPDCDWSFRLDTMNPRLFCTYARGAFLFLLIIPLANAQLQPVSLGYPNFGDAMNSGIQTIVDPNSFGSVTKVTCSKPIHLWKKSSNEVTYFTTNFSFVFFSNHSSYGYRYGFTSLLPNAKYTAELNGGGLGLGRVDNQTLLPTEHQFKAVEFDNLSNQSSYGDGLAFFLASTNLPNANDAFSNHPTEHQSAEEEFDAFSNHPNVNDTSELKGGDLGPGHVDNQTLPSNADHTKKSKFINRKLLGGIGIGLGLSVTLFGLVYVLLRKMNKRKEEEATSETASDLKMDDEFQLGNGPKKISYEELISATNNFEVTQKLGQGGFGCVYKGYFKDLNSYAAIKRISAGSAQGVKEYAEEVTIISQLRHRNLVKLSGWCHRKNDLFLIYEYMPNGSLDSHLFRGESILSWHVRYNIALGLASALFYLQEEWEKCVLHRDIKSSNILLDSHFNAKLGDFGLARIADHEKGSHTMVVAGTIGYLDPEYVKTGRARKESDIFSFGVVLLEVASGRKAIFHHKEKKGQVSLIEWVWELHRFRNVLAAADLNLNGEFDVQQMECLLVVGLWCANPDCKSRPTIRQVIKVLNLEAPLPVLPLKIPVLDYNPPTTNEFFFSVSSSFQDAS